MVRLTVAWQGGEQRRSKDRQWSVTAPREKEHVKEKLKMTKMRVWFLL